MLLFDDDKSQSSMIQGFRCSEKWCSMGL